MKKASRDLLSKLCSEHTKASLVGLWTDLTSLSRDQFLAELESIKSETKGPAKRKAAKKKERKPAPKSNRPAARIAFVLQEERNISDVDARRRLSAVLVSRGYEEADIPDGGSGDLLNWLELLLQAVPSAEVMDAARSA